MPRLNDQSLANPLHIALSKQRRATTSLASPIGSIAERMPNAEYWQMLLDKPSGPTEAQVDKICNAITARQSGDFENAHALAVVLFECSGTIVRTTRLGRAFAAIAEKSKVTCLADLVELAVRDTQSTRTRRAALIRDLQTPQNWPDDLPDQSSLWDFHRLIEISPELQQWLLKAGCGRAEDEPQNPDGGSSNPT